MALNPLSERNELSTEARRVLDVMRSRSISDEDKVTLVEELKASVANNASEYISSVLFPDLYEPQRFPMIFPNPTAVFKLTEVFDFTPGSSGKFFIELFPQNISYTGDSSTFENAYLNVYRGFSTDYNSGQGGFNLRGIPKTVGQSVEYTDPGFSKHDTIADYFEQVVLRAACVKVYYVGEIEKTSGYIESCIDYYYDPKSEKHPKEQDVIKGFYRQFALPTEGMRVIWLPKDYTDYNFTQVDKDLSDSAISRRDLSRLCIYGSGLENEPLRIEVVRHFEGFPRVSIKDYVDTRRPASSQANRTMETIGKIHNSAPGLVTIKPKDLFKAAMLVRRKSSNIDAFLDRVSTYIGAGESMVNRASSLYNFGQAALSSLF